MTDTSNTEGGGRHVGTEAAETAAPPNEERKAGLGSLAEDAAHPFDQTNGIIDGLEGDADDPDKVEERLRGEGVNENPLGVGPLDLGAKKSGSEG